uniref:Uncharacterized protein n=1 Tax=Tetraselmis sp. GSL018 TaxID=582737 RepID=A0A061R7P9_9CHLO|eukprot:CAMPEP_0177599566 /NCGR_PEP_ID=MMETSP0419_2-20121207/13073_1 /TAXON_ID=582737 /ORGANISM="Tetraselmis sp., Strain GSL018" /LENGTH=110 /DNA_ID=CAMNT_0019092331 /DNA_START=172 /DNA_END=504 /DNA_ORIENTATION=+
MNNGVGEDGWERTAGENGGRDGSVGGREGVREYFPTGLEQNGSLRWRCEDGKGRWGGGKQGDDEGRQTRKGKKMEAEKRRGEIGDDGEYICHTWEWRGHSEMETGDSGRG